MVTLQSMYDKVAKHLLKQNAVSRITNTFSNAMCAYRSPDGLKCAIGCLIPDSLYSPGMEGKSIDALCEHFPLSDYIIPGRLAYTLQKIHDADEVHEWPKMLRLAAVEFGLREVEP